MSYDASHPTDTRWSRRTSPCRRWCPAWTRSTRCTQSPWSRNQHTFLPVEQKLVPRTFHLLADLSRSDIGTHVSEEVLVEGLPDLHEVIGDGPLRVPHRVVEVGAGDRSSGGVIGLHKVILHVPSSRGWLQNKIIVTSQYPWQSRQYSRISLFCRAPQQSSCRESWNSSSQTGRHHPSCPLPWLRSLLLQENAIKLSENIEI